MARVVREHRVELAELLASEQNKTLGLAQVEIDVTAEYFDYHAGPERRRATGASFRANLAGKQEERRPRRPW